MVSARSTGHRQALNEEVMLPGFEMGRNSVEREGSENEPERSGFNDPAFAGNKALPVHRWVPWIAGFSSDFVSGALSRYLVNQGTVLDPFSGVGTTLVEAINHGHNAIGFEINPYAALACRVKTTASSINVKSLTNSIARFHEFCKSKINNGYQPRSMQPEGFKTRDEFYSPKVLHKVLVVYDFLDTVAEENLRSLFDLAFAATMVRYSNYSYEPSLGRRVSAGKQQIEDFAVAASVEAKLWEMCEDIAWLQAHMPQNNQQARVINDTFFNSEQHVAQGSIDLVITSPPYLNNYHYNRNTRPQLYWLGYAQKPKDFQALEEANFGKFWQTVRERESLELEFDLAGSDLSERINVLRSLNTEKGIYGGHGWANYAAAYFNDCRRCALGIKHVLRSGGTALVVIGNSILQGVLMPTDQYFGRIAESVGLELVGIEIPRAARVGNSIIQSNVRVGKAKDKQHLYEAVVELKKR